MGSIKPLNVELLSNLHGEMEILLNRVDFEDPVSRLNFLHGDVVKKLIMLCYNDSRAYSKVFYPDRFNLPFSPQHDELFAALDEKDEKGEPKNKYVVVKAYRGFGKSSLAKTIAAKRIRYRDANFVAYIGKNEGFSIMQTEGIKNSCLLNRLENFLFGDIKVKYDNSGVDRSFSKKSWTTSFGTMVIPRGAGQPVRGLLHDWEGKSFRPDLFVIDDLEDPDLISSEQYRNDLYEWFLGSVVESKPLPGVSTNWQFLYIDTLKHEDAVLQRIMERDEWLALDLPLCDDNYKSLAPDFYPDSYIQAELEQHRKFETMDIFYQEKMGLPISLEGAAFQESYFRYYAEDDNVEDNKKNFTGFVEEKKKIETVVIFDPAKTVKLHSAYTGFVVVSFNIFLHRIFFRYAEGLKLFPDEIYQKAFSLALQYGANVIGYEETSLNEFIRKPLTDAMLESGHCFELVPLKARSGGSREFSGHLGGKKARIASMIPYYRKGQVYHNVVSCGALEVQLRAFPKSKNWDVMDSAAYFVELLESGNRFWVPPEALTADEKQLESQYIKMEREDALVEELGDWRLI